ncbi:threonine synthase [Pedobacter foliorum]|uniref:threonine synthase n=1 Tax=Pedobacter foliorum TaxID=2739058 RepID=UPI0015671C84|nr:threonine synthase [Pedobacter foliorum]NRF39279.1 threonine synthase [Pedobacter foliorum]
MKLYSTNNHSLSVDFATAVFNSMPLDKGLYMPVSIPELDKEFIDNIDQFSLSEIAFKVASALLKGAMPEEDLQSIIEDAINFEAPVVALDDNTAVLELFHGPSLAFKDFGARFMSRIMAYFLKNNEKTLDVLVATSGDTGGAVALGFLGVPNTRVTILYPKGKVSEIQELQLCTNGQNIHALEVNGTFDDCQSLVKQAFADDELNAKLRLTSANSINISRLIPQTFYYFNAYAQLKRQGKAEVVFSVPSGNFGNIAAGLLAYKMGLPVKKFIAATNVNDTVPRFLETGVYETKPSVQTYSNAMDVGAPSNWVRIMDLFKNDKEALQQVVQSYRFTDEETLKGINAIYEQFNYIACPHTAIAWLALQQYKLENADINYTGVFLSTAHACKFPDVFPDRIKTKIEFPDQVKDLLAKPKKAENMNTDYESFKAYLNRY